MPAHDMVPVLPLQTYVMLNNDTHIVLSDPQAVGQEYIVVDNLLLGHVTNVDGLFATGRGTVTMSDPGWSLKFTWLGKFWGVST